MMPGVNPEAIIQFSTKHTKTIHNVAICGESRNVTFLAPLWENQPKESFLPTLFTLSVALNCRVVVLFDCMNDWNHISKTSKITQIPDQPYDIVLEKEMRSPTGCTVLSWIRLFNSALRHNANDHRTITMQNAMDNSFRLALLRNESLHTNHSFRSVASWNGFSDLYNM
jgi:hypothetical protein